MPGQPCTGGPRAGGACGARAGAGLQPGCGGATGRVCPLLKSQLCLEPRRWAICLAGRLLYFEMASGIDGCVNHWSGIGEPLDDASVPRVSVAPACCPAQLLAAAGWLAGRGLNDLAVPFPIFLLDNSTAANAAQRAVANTQLVRPAAAPCALLALFLGGAGRRQTAACSSCSCACTLA